MFKDSPGCETQYCKECVERQNIIDNLKGYAEHTWLCNMRNTNVVSRKCTCGLDKILDKTIPCFNFRFEKPKLIPLFAMAQRLYVSAKWLRAEAEAGKIPHLKAGSKILFNPDVIEKLLIERANKGDGKDYIKCTNMKI